MAGTRAQAGNRRDLVHAASATGSATLLPSIDYESRVPGELYLLLSSQGLRLPSAAAIPYFSLFTRNAK
jgi:hypothetical protein